MGAFQGEDKMAYYHVIINNFSKLTKKIDIIVDLNQSEEYIKETVADPYNKGEEFNFKGRRIEPEYIDSLNIIKSKEALPDQEGIFISESLKEGNTFETTLHFLEAEDVTELFINRQLKLKTKIELQQPANLTSPNKNIFIVHGRNHEPMKELKAILIDLGYTPIVLHEQAGGGSLTLVEKLEKYANKVGYAFVILTPEDIGGHKDEIRGVLGAGAPLLSRPVFVGPNFIEDILNEFESRARQNVIFEMGYFFALLGRRRVCCLLKGQMEKPTDIDGVEYGFFNDSINEAKDKIIVELKEAYEKKAD